MSPLISDQCAHSHTHTNTHTLTHTQHTHTHTHTHTHLPTTHQTLYDHETTRQEQRVCSLDTRSMRIRMEYRYKTIFMAMRDQGRSRIGNIAGLGPNKTGRNFFVMDTIIAIALRRPNQILKRHRPNGMFECRWETALPGFWTYT